MGKTLKSARCMPFSTRMKALKTMGVFKRGRISKKFSRPFAGVLPPLLNYLSTKGRGRFHARPRGLSEIECL